jgi:4-alpha-glucanotransferase
MAKNVEKTGRTDKTEKAGGKIPARCVGTAVPVAALRGKDSAGCGEFLDLVEFAALAKNMGLGLIQILPVNDTGYESSPYSALSAFALNPVYIKISALDEADGFQKHIDEIRARFDGGARFPYHEVARAKLELLREIFQAKKTEIEKNAPLKKWIDENGWIKVYAVFRRLKEANDLKSWHEWKAFNTVSKKEIEALWTDSASHHEHLFWSWVQFNLDAQFRQAASDISKLGIFLEGDLPILINEDSADVWAHPEFFNNDFSAGAPPDMYSPDGQNWGFPIYNWDELEKADYVWWKERLVSAAKYFDAYRIDHVLGFFRIWATGRINSTALMGRFIPDVPIKMADFKALGWDSGRIRWATVPHIPTNEVWRAVYDAGGSAADVQRVFDAALSRIGNEDLWIFKDSVKGEKDITSLPIHESGKRYLVFAWSNRIFQEYEKGAFSPVWYYRNSRAWASLSQDEKHEVEGLIEKKQSEGEKKWGVEGKKLLSVLKESASMLPCAEDLGDVPACVPSVLEKLKILGLRVVRWTRYWEQNGQPYVPFYEYPELSVCTPAVHDSSTVREWWEREANQDDFAAFIGCPTLPKSYNPGTARLILKSVAQAASRFRVFQIQDLLHLSNDWYAEDPASERVNVPGTANTFNWTYRLPAPIAEIAKDGELIARIRELCATPPEARPKGR